jgi:predicted  nucleic acid-binding Zn-ribbon protein
MATTNIKSHCSICNDEQDTYECKGCLTIFCFNHLTDHREMINQEFIQIEHHFNSFRQKLHDQKEDPNHYSLFKQINQWENESIYKIKQTAQQCRDEINEYLFKIENQFNQLTERTKEIRKQNKINEINSKQIKKKFNKLNKEFEKPKNVSIQQRSSTFIHQIFVRIEESEKNSI